MAAKLLVWSQTKFSHWCCVKSSSAYNLRCPTRVISWSLSFCCFCWAILSCWLWFASHQICWWLRHLFPFVPKVENFHVEEVHRRLLHWMFDTSLTVILRKCKSLVISSSLNCYPVFLQDVQIVDKLKLLGVTLDNKLSWKEHTNSVISSTSKLLFLFRLFRRYFNQSDLISVYFTHFFAHFFVHFLYIVNISSL